MEKIASLTDLIEKKRYQDQIRLSRHIIDTLRWLVNCTACKSKCAMCAKPFTDNAGFSVTAGNLKFSLCENCNNEYESYQASAYGKDDFLPKFWHNKEWAELWFSWIEYQKAVQNFRNSKEFNLIKQYMGSDNPDCC